MPHPDAYLLTGRPTRCASASAAGVIEMMMTHAESPVAAESPGSANRIMHARLVIGGRA
jgi:hypothetical protein